MNREETLALYERAQKEGVEVWNKWANEMLEERKRLQEEGNWVQNKGSWEHKATAIFSTNDIPHTFNDSVYFDNYIFPARVVLVKAIFKNYAFFDNTTFHGKIDFQNANFNSTASFLKTVFDGPALFNDCNFEGPASFHRCSFNENIWFLKTTFYEKADFELAQFYKKVSFRRANFLKASSFEAIHAEGFFSLERATFQNQVPNFNQAHFVEAPRLDNIELEDEVPPGNFKKSITTFIHPDIKARYQALKRLAVQAHDHESEQRFWAGVLRSDRSLRTEDGGWNRRSLFSAFWWGNIAYGFFSDYGRSIVRPLGTLLVLVILMTSLHLFISKKPLTYENTFSAGYISTSKSIFNLGADPTKRSILKEKYNALYGVTENQTPNIPKSILIAEMGQTLLSAIFIFLTLLGVRNNFKMK